jgi:hypothetical protein
VALAPLALLLLPSLLGALATTALLLGKTLRKMRQRSPPAPPPPRWWAELAPPLRALLGATLPLLTLVLGALQLDRVIALSWWAVLAPLWPLLALAVDSIQRMQRAAASSAGAQAEQERMARRQGGHALLVLSGLLACCLLLLNLRLGGQASCAHPNPDPSPDPNSDPNPNPNPNPHPNPSPNPNPNPNPTQASYGAAIVVSPLLLVLSLFCCCSCCLACCGPGMQAAVAAAEQAAEQAAAAEAAAGGYVPQHDETEPPSGGGGVARAASVPDLASAPGEPPKMQRGRDALVPPGRPVPRPPAAAAARGAEDRSSVGSAAMDDVVDLGQWLRDPAGGGRSGTPNTPKEARGGDKWAAMSVRELKSELKARGISQEGAFEKSELVALLREAEGQGGSTT